MTAMDKSMDKPNQKQAGQDDPQLREQFQGKGHAPPPPTPVADKTSRQADRVAGQPGQGDTGHHASNREHLPRDNRDRNPMRPRR